MSAQPASARDAAGVRVLAATADLRALDAHVERCHACPRLVAWREQVAREKRAAYADQQYWGAPVPSFGDPSPHTLVVGLAPAAHGANRTGRMFTGDRSGDVLFAGLHRAGFASQPTSTHAGDGLALRGVRITASAHCAPPGNKPTREELATCAGWLDREFTLLAPGLRSILALGGIGWDAVLATARRLGWGVVAPKPAFAHGAQTALHVAGQHAITLIGSYHVSQQNTFTGRLTPAMLDDVLARL